MCIRTHARVCFTPIPLSLIFNCFYQWGAATSAERGPVLATNTNEGMRNAIGAHSGSYCIYRGLAVASGTLDPVR